MNKQIKNNNKLIAEFMGWKQDESGFYPPKQIKIINEFQVQDDCENCFGSYVGDLPLYVYHISWDWLMPVVEKIESIQLPSPSMIPVRVKISGTSCSIFKGTWNDDKEGFISKYFQEDEKGEKIQSTYDAVVEFIEWYNKN